MDEDKIKQIQAILGVTADGKKGPMTNAAWDALGKIVPMPVVDDGEQHISDRGLDLIKEFEGWFPDAYRDEVGVWTIGWGHTGLTHQDGTVYPGRHITKEEGMQLLHHDMTQFEKDVKQHITRPMTQEQFDALVSFDFNTGGLGKSTLKRMFNEGDIQGAADQFLRWNKAGGQVLRGLTRRRQSERNRFLGKDPFIVES